MSRPFGIVADDLTGAADCAMQFAAPGSPVSVALRVDQLPASPLGVVAVDTDSRWLGEAAAAERVAHAAARVHGAGMRPYVKVDSLLRGHPLATAHAVAVRLGLRTVLFAPAFPGQQRTVIGGRLAVAERPGIDVVAMARAHFDEVWPLPVDVVRRGPAGIARLLMTSGTRPPACVVADSETAQDLIAVAGAATRAGADVLPAGSAGLAAGFAPTCPATDVGGSPTVRTLIVVGSRSSVATAQIRSLQATGVPVTTMGGKARPRTVTESLMHHLSAGRVAVLRTAPLPPTVTPDVTAARMLAAHLADVVRTALSRGGIDRLVLIGGDTARAVLIALGANGLLVKGAGPAGSCTASLTGGSHAGLDVVTRAGAFGSRDSLLPLAGATTEKVKP